MKSIEVAREEKFLEILMLQKPLDKLHNEVSVTVNNRPKRAISAHNAATSTVHPSELYVGDFVLIGHATYRGHKFSFMRTGPMRVENADSECAYTTYGLYSIEV